jgi:hypothetical protein
MQDLVNAFVNETRVMSEAHREHVLKVEKERQLAYDSLSSVDFVCSNWKDENDIEALKLVRNSIATKIQSLGNDRKAVESIQSELNDRKETVKSCLVTLLTLYRELVGPSSSTSVVEKEVADVLYHARPDFLYYVTPQNDEPQPIQDDTLAADIEKGLSEVMTEPISIIPHSSVS